MTTGTKEQRAVATAALAGNHGFSLISNEKLLQLYTSMVKCRMIEERVLEFSKRHNLAGNGNAVTGREAAAAGVAIDLLPEDTVVPSQGNLIINFIKGDPLTSVFRPLFTRATEPGLASQLELAASAAVTNEMKNNGKIALAFFSGESSSPAIWHDALLNAGANRLPILFVRHTVGPANAEVPAISEEIAIEAQACGLPGIIVDGSDVVAVYRVATEAITHARKGNGATLIECVTCCSGDHPEIDPILKMEAYLSRKGLFSEELKLEAAAGFGSQLDAALEAEIAGMSA